MAFEIEGIDKLIKKLNKLSNIEAKKIVESVADDVEKAIVNSAKSFSDTEYLYIKKCETRNYGSSHFIDIGLKNDEVDFNLWRGLWFHNWGYHHWKNGKYIAPHSMWFDNAVASIGESTTAKIKAKLKQEIKEFNS